MNTIHMIIDVYEGMKELQEKQHIHIINDPFPALKIASKGYDPRGKGWIIEVNIYENVENKTVAAPAMKFWVIKDEWKPMSYYNELDDTFKKSIFFGLDGLPQINEAIYSELMTESEKLLTFVKERGYSIKTAQQFVPREFDENY